MGRCLQLMLTKKLNEPAHELHDLPHPHLLPPVRSNQADTNMNRRKFAKSLLAGVVGLGVAKTAAAKVATNYHWDPLVVCGVDPGWDTSVFTMTWGKWNPDGSFEIVKRETWGTPPGEEKLRKISENFKANLGSCWVDAKEGTVEYFSEPK